ncbi:putative glycerol-3-phosphate transporter 5 isoform X1 [Nymphaea colorata]|nr:putative glycerol-3-phosphate transporter 5 isoform X1 [Nymphaea colorata]
MEVRRLPPGLHRLNSKLHIRSVTFFQVSVLVITFLAYACFHASRKPPSIVKSVIGPRVAADGVEIPEFGGVPDSIRENSTSADGGGWAPFNGVHGTHRLGELDVAFLAVYSLGMYFAGHVGDRIDLRAFLAFGMVGSGLFTILFGMGYWWNIHSFTYFLVVQMIAGVFQSTGWPSVVAIVGNWFGKSKRGLIMGVWNSHTSVGNICGSLIASWALEYGWGWSFALPGIAIALMGVIVYHFLVVKPEDAGLGSPSQELQLNTYVHLEQANVMDCNDEGVVVVIGSNLENEMAVNEISKKAEDEGKEGEGKSMLLSPELPGSNGIPASENSEKVDRRKDEERELLRSSELPEPKAISFIDAWRIPGVAPYAFCLFFSKLVAYTFLYWLPFYVRHTAVAGSFLSHKTSGLLSTLFDVGGVLGGILAGYISDKLEARAVTSIIFFCLSIPTLILYRIYGSFSMSANIALMFLSGLFVNGPYSLITTAVAADLGTDSGTTGSSRALATVTAIIDGTGSVGAALGPLLTGYISSRGWNGVFLMLILATFIAALLLVRVAKEEYVNKVRTSG